MMTSGYNLSEITHSLQEDIHAFTIIIVTVVSNQYQS